MFSIGILGFLVWSHWMAFLIRKFKVINFTVGWKNLNLLSTFYSLNDNKNIQSAGNLEVNKGTSETIRENTYDMFLNNFFNLYKKNFNKDYNWLEWFIGFTEGDGAILEHKGRCKYVLTQKDIKVLKEIQETFNFGNIKYYYDNNNNIKYGRYIVSDNKNILLLYLLFNGNLYLEHRKEQLKKWQLGLLNASRLNLLAMNLNNIPNIINNYKKISLNNAWLSGFTDAEGCFSIKIYKNRNIDYVKIIYILDQKNSKDILNNISYLLSNKYLAKLRKTVNGNMYRIEVSCNNKKKDIYLNVISYFDKYKLKTTKFNSFLIWKKILFIVLGNQPLPPETILKIRKLRHNMNKYIILNNSIGYSSKS